MSTAAVEAKRILMTADAVGGVWQYAVDLSRALCAHGCEVLLAVLGPEPSQEQSSSAEAIPGLHLTSAPFALEWMEQPWEDVARSKDWLLEIEREFRPDIVHLNSYSLAGAAWSAPTLVVAHSCVVSWWQAVHGVMPPGERDEYRRQVRAGLRTASCIAAPSRSMADSLAANYEIDREAIAVIPNFSSAEIASSQPKQELFLAAGRMWDKAKNLVLLEAIASKLAWPIALAGSESPSRAPAPGSLHHLGKLLHSALGQQMARAAVFVHPALYEPFGLAVLEAARSRCGLVLADIPSLRELWDGAAVFIDPRDPHAWICALNGLARKSAVREELAARAACHADRYRGDGSVPAYLAIYERALNSREAGAAA